MAKARSRRPRSLTHVDAEGRVRMVDVGAKSETAREAIAMAEIRVSADAVRAVRRGAVKKGDPLQTARIAGIMAAKRTAEIIPLCHPLPLSKIDVDVQPMRGGFRIFARVATVARTGVEMEALTAVAAAALTIYDMLKAVDRTMVIGRICVLEKTGGARGDYRRR
jgi:cyclic pyranopterin phosphate synthase